MVEIKEQYPYIDEFGNPRYSLIKHWAEDELGNKYYIKQVETGRIYETATDVYPCKYSYEVTNEQIEGGEDVNDSNE